MLPDPWPGSQLFWPAAYMGNTSRPISAIGNLFLSYSNVRYPGSDRSTPVLGHVILAASGFGTQAAPLAKIRLARGHYRILGMLCRRDGSRSDIQFHSSIFRPKLNDEGYKQLNPEYLPLKQRIRD